MTPQLFPGHLLILTLICCVSSSVSHVDVRMVSGLWEWVCFSLAVCEWSWASGEPDVGAAAAGLCAPLLDHHLPVWTMETMHRSDLLTHLTTNRHILAAFYGRIINGNHLKWSDFIWKKVQSLSQHVPVVKYTIWVMFYFVIIADFLLNCHWIMGFTFSKPFRKTN